MSLRRAPICPSATWACGRPFSGCLAGPPASSSLSLWHPWHLGLHLPLHLHLHLPAPCAHAPAPACNCSHRKEAGCWGAGHWVLQPCWWFPLFKLSAGPTPPSNPPILSCVPSQLHLTNCFVSVHRPSCVHQHPARPSTTVHRHPGTEGDLDTGTMGMFTDRDCCKLGWALAWMTSHPFCPTALLLATSCLASPAPCTLPSTPPLSQRRSSNNPHHYFTLTLGSQLGALKPCFSPFFFPQPHAHTRSHPQIAPMACLLCLPL